MKIKTIIVDDEHHMRESLSLLLQNHHPDFEVMGMAAGVEEAYMLITREQPELVLLDIKMPDGSGFDLLRKFDNPTFRVIFITAYDSYALDAFRFSALDYLLKPLNTHELQAALERFVETRQSYDDLGAKVKAFASNLEAMDRDKKKVVLKTRDSIHLVPINNILRFESDENYTWVYQEAKDRLLISKPLKQFDDLLSDYGFLRIHQSHLINLHHLTRIDKVDGGQVVLSDGIPLPISVRKREQVFRMLERYLG